MCRGRAGCVLAQVQSPSLPPGPALPSGIPPYAPISQPAVQFLLQGSLPLPGCGAAQSMAPVSTTPTAASEPAGHAAATTAANNSEERTAPPRPTPEKAKNEEVRPLLLLQGQARAGSPVPSPHRCPCPQYMKKLHVQERAVEEVKLAIKPFYQKREVTKEEYKDILRKAVQKVGGACAPWAGWAGPVSPGLRGHTPHPLAVAGHLGVWGVKAAVRERLLKRLSNTTFNPTHG